MKADHNTITPFSVKVMTKYKVLSKSERSVIKKYEIFLLVSIVTVFVFRCLYACIVEFLGGGWHLTEKNDSIYMKKTMNYFGPYSCELFVYHPRWTIWVPPSMNYLVPTLGELFVYHPIELFGSHPLWTICVPSSVNYLCTTLYELFASHPLWTIWVTPSVNHLGHTLFELFRSYPLWTIWVPPSVNYLGSTIPPQYQLVAAQFKLQLEANTCSLTNGNHGSMQALISPDRHNHGRGTKYD